MKRRRLRRKAQIGEPVVVRVETPATSGYRWHFALDPAWRLAGESVAPSLAMGGASRTEFRFEPLRAGKMTIRGTLQRPWEEDPIEQLDIVVTAE